LTFELTHNTALRLIENYTIVIRQCIAMAFPPDIPPELYNGQIERERIIADKEYYTLTQNSSHIDNFLFGPESSLSPDTDHDPGVPVVKVSSILAGERIFRRNPLYCSYDFMRIIAANLSYSLLTSVGVQLKTSETLQTLGELNFSHDTIN
jgi:hypothetical protein